MVVRFTLVGMLAAALGGCLATPTQYPSEWQALSQASGAGCPRLAGTFANKGEYAKGGTPFLLSSLVLPPADAERATAVELKLDHDSLLTVRVYAGATLIDSKVLSQKEALTCAQGMLSVRRSRDTADRGFIPLPQYFVFKLGMASGHLIVDRAEMQGLGFAAMPVGNAWARFPAAR